MDDEKIIMLPLNVKPTFEQFLEMLFIKKDSLGAKLIRPAYFQIFIEGVDVKALYDKYYSVEYETLGEYLEVCYNESLTENDLSMKHIFKFKDGYGFVLTDPAYDKGYLDRIIQLLKNIEVTDED